MAEGRKNNKPKLPIWFFVILAVVVVCSCYTLFNQQMMLNELNEDTEKANERLKKAEQINAELMLERENLEKPEYLEKLAREELGMTRHGELPYIYTKKQQ